MTNEEIAILIQQGQTELYSDLWKQNEKLFKFKANSLYNYRCEECARSGVEFDDIFQCCFLALIDAVKAFKADKGYKLTTYLDYHLKNHLNTLLGLRSSKRDSLNYSKSLDEPINVNGDEIPLSDLIPDKNAENQMNAVNDIVYLKELHDALEELLSLLPKDQSRLLRRIYYKSEAMTSVAQEMSCSRSCIHQRTREALRHLKRLSNKNQLRRFLDEVIEQRAYIGTGLNSFLYSGTSSVERTIIKLDEIESDYQTLENERMKDNNERINESEL